MIESITVKFKNGKTAELKLENGELTVDEQLQDLSKPTRFADDIPRTLRIESEIDFKTQKLLEKAALGLD